MGQIISKGCFRKSGGLITGTVVFEKPVGFNDYISLQSQSTQTGFVHIGANGEQLALHRKSEEVTIPVGQGAGGVDSAGVMISQDSIVLGCVTRITQAPGGGATTVSVGRSTNPDEFAKLAPVTLGSTTTWPANNDTTMEGPIFNAGNYKLRVTTNVNVTGSAMKIRLTTWYFRTYPQGS